MTNTINNTTSATITINLLDPEGNLIRNSKGEVQTTQISLTEQQLSSIVTNSMQVAIMHKQGKEIGNVMAELEEVIREVKIGNENVSATMSVGTPSNEAVVVIQGQTYGEVLIALAPPGIGKQELNNTMREAVTSQLGSGSDRIDISKVGATLVDFGFDIPANVTQFSVTEIVTEYIALTEGVDEDQSESNRP